jgi:hypothetical protein
LKTGIVRQGEKAKGWVNQIRNTEHQHGCRTDVGDQMRIRTLTVVGWTMYW